MTKRAHELPASSRVGDNNKQGDAGGGFDDVPDEKEAEEEAGLVDGTGIKSDAEHT